MATHSESTFGHSQTMGGDGPVTARVDGRSSASVDGRTGRSRIGGDGAHDSRSLAELVRELRDESTLLMRQEIALAKTEVSEKVSKIGRNIAYLIVGGAVAHLGLIFLLLAASEGLTLGLFLTELSSHAIWIAPLIVGLVVGIVGMALMGKAKRTLADTDLTPHKTIETLKEDKQWAQTKTQ